MSNLINLDQEARALTLCELRGNLIARNLANTNTPNFKSQDLNFSEAMENAIGETTLVRNHINHLSGEMLPSQSIYYRIPMQKKNNNNTVDDEIERKNFIENSLRYQMTIGSLEKKAAQYIKAIRGE